MLFQKLLGSNGAVTPPTPAIQYVGGYVQGFVGITTDVTISLTSLTGGLASAPAEGDLVVVYFATASIVDRNLVVAGYSEFSELYSNGTSQDTNLVAARKFMSATPDTSITLTGGTLATTDAGTIAVQVFRGVNAYLVAYVTTTTATGQATVGPNPPSITPTLADSVVVSGGASVGALTFTSSDLTDFITVNSSDTYSSTVGMGYKQWLSGAFNPAALSASAPNSWAAITAVLGPLLTTPGFVSFSFNQAAGAFSVTRPSNIQQGDLLILIQQSASSDPYAVGSIPAGWITVAPQFRSLRVAVKIASSSESGSYSIGVANGDPDLRQAVAILCYRQSSFYSVGVITGSTANAIIAPEGATVMGYATAFGSSAVIDQSSYFANNKLVNDSDATAPSLTVFAKNNVSAGSTGTVAFTSANTSVLLALTTRPSGNFVYVVDTNAVLNATTMTVPAHSAGDWLVVVRGNQTITPPTLLSGYTDLGTIVADGAVDRSARVQYIVSDGTIASISVPYYGSVAIIRGASSVGQSAFRNSATSQTTITLPTITGLTTGVGSLILGGSYVATIATASNYGFLPNFGLQISGPTPSSISDATITFSSASLNAAFAIEFLP